MGSLSKGDKVWFANKKKPYKVRACNDRFAICTQPYNFKPHTVIYTIVDFERNVRGMDNYVFGIYDYYSDEDCEQALQELISNEMEVSYRNYVELDITKVVHDDEDNSFKLY